MRTAWAWIVVACACIGAPLRAHGEDQLAEFSEALAYCRWADATALAKDDAERLRVSEESQRESLDYAYLVGVDESESDRYLRWRIRFATRPKIISGCRLNFYVVTDTRVLRMQSRWIQDVLRAEHSMDFAFDKAWQSAEGLPIATRVELCYDGHAVDVISTGHLLLAQWWKREVSGGLLFYGKDGEGAPAGNTYRFVDTQRGNWRLASVTDTHRRGDRRPERPGLEGTDVLPDNEKGAEQIPEPHGAYVCPTARPSAPSEDRDERVATDGELQAMSDRVLELEERAAYGPDGSIASAAKSLAKQAERQGMDDAVARLQRLQHRLGVIKREGTRKILAIKRLDIAKPTADTQGYWDATLYFQAPREPPSPIRVNVYALTQSGKIYGTYLALRLVWNSPSQEFAQIFSIDSTELGSRDPIVRWRAEVGLDGVCCDVEDVGGRPKDDWWLGKVDASMRRRDSTSTSAGSYRLLHWGRIVERGASSRFRAEERD